MPTISDSSAESSTEVNRTYPYFWIAIALLVIFSILLVVATPAAHDFAPQTDTPKVSQAGSGG